MNLQETYRDMLLLSPSVGVTKPNPMHNLSWFCSLNWAPIFEWCVVRCGSHHRHQEDVYSKIVGLPAQNMLFSLGLIVNIIGNWGGAGGNIIVQ